MEKRTLFLVYRARFLLGKRGGDALRLPGILLGLLRDAEIDLPPPERETVVDHLKRNAQPGPPVKRGSERLVTSGDRVQGLAQRRGLQTTPTIDTTENTPKWEATCRSSRDSSCAADSSKPASGSVNFAPNFVSPALAKAKPSSAIGPTY